MPIVVGHFGNFCSEVIAAMQQHPNLYLETSIFGSTPRNIEYVARKVGVERILFGSDVPYSHQKIERMKIDLCNLSPTDKELMLYGNAARLLKLE